MISILSLFFLLAQTNYFEFLDYPQTGGIAGDSFDIYVVAKKANGEIDTSYNGRALLKTSLDGIWPWPYVYPPLLSFQRGEVRSKAVVTLANESLSLVVEDGNIRGNTSRIIFLPNIPKRLLITLPGETLLSGSPQGRHYSPHSQRAGSPFFPKVFIVDKNFNIVNTRFDTLQISASDSFATYPSFLPLFAGREVFSYLPRAKGTTRIFAKDLSDPQISSDTSSPFLVMPGFYSRLLLLLPGEDFRFGDTSSLPWMTPGKKGKPLPQFVQDSFLVRVFCCDSFYNPTNGVDTVYLFSDFSFSYSPAPGSVSDSISFWVKFFLSGENQNIWARSARGFETYRSYVNILPKASYLFVNYPDTILAGWETEIAALVLDAGSSPIPYKRVEFQVIKGHGVMLDSVVLTDSLGWAKAKFILPLSNLRDSVSERDSILIRTDTIDTIIGIWVELYSREVARGEIIAFPNPFGSLNQDWTSIGYFLPIDVDTRILIYDPFGNLVFEEKIPKGSPGAKKGVNKFVWEGKDNKGNRVSSGIYYLRVIGISHTGRVCDKGYTIGVVW